jgi:hypothetical protein
VGAGVNGLREAAERLASACGLPEILAASHAGLDAILPVINARVRVAPVTGSARPATGIVAVSSRRTTGLMSSGGPALPRSRSLNAQVRSARRIASSGNGRSSLAIIASVASVSAQAIERRWFGAAYGPLRRGVGEGERCR